MRFLGKIRQKCQLLWQTSAKVSIEMTKKIKKLKGPIFDNLTKFCLHCQCQGPICEAKFFAELMIVLRSNAPFLRMPL